MTLDDRIDNKIDNKIIKKYGLNPDNLLYSVLKTKNFPHTLLKEVLNDQTDYTKKYDNKYIIEWYYDYLVKSNAISMPNSIDNLMYVINKTGHINYVFLKNLLDNIEILKKTYETYNVNDKIVKLYECIISKCMKPGFYNYLLNKFKLCTIYERSLYYLKRLLMFKKKYSELYDCVKIKFTKFEGNQSCYELYCIYNHILMTIKKSKTELENLLITVYEGDVSKIDNYVFLSDCVNNDIITAETGTRFVKKLGYTRKVFTEIENMKLKRGFIIGLENGNNEFIFKYQPNKSVSEIVINNYLRHKKLTSVLLPSVFYLNTDNSYFSIIQKYDTDLHKYYNILDKKGKLINLNTLIKIMYGFCLSIKEFKENGIIHTDLKLENTVLNLDSQSNIVDMKIIDFDLSVFEGKPDFEIQYAPFKKILTSKKNRGTKTYMKDCDNVTYHNDIYSMGIIGIILLYKTVRLIISNYKIYSSILEHNTKYIIKNRNINKEIQRLRENITVENNKIGLLNICVDFFIKMERLKFNKCFNLFFENNNGIHKLNLLKRFITDCFDDNNNIEGLINKYNELFIF